MITVGKDIATAQFPICTTRSDVSKIHDSDFCSAATSSSGWLAREQDWDQSQTLFFMSKTGIASIQSFQFSVQPCSPILTPFSLPWYIKSHISFFTRQRWDWTVKSQSPDKAGATTSSSDWLHQPASQRSFNSVQSSLMRKYTQLLTSLVYLLLVLSLHPSVHTS